MDTSLLVSVNALCKASILDILSCPSDFKAFISLKCFNEKGQSAAATVWQLQTLPFDRVFRCLPIHYSSFPVPEGRLIENGLQSFDHWQAFQRW